MRDWRHTNCNIMEFVLDSYVAIMKSGILFGEVVHSVVVVCTAGGKSVLNRFLQHSVLHNETRTRREGQGQKARSSV
jgi:hypothetical protein